MDVREYLSSPLHGFTIVADALEWGVPIESRYGKCFEILGGTQDLTPRVLATRKGINLSLGWMEMLQLIGGVFDPLAIQRVAPKANQSLFTYPMAYGPRVIGQVPFLLEALHANQETRQAVLFIGNQIDGPTSNLPCTLSIQFFLRENKLSAVTSMRSWDLCRGLPYDIMMFQGIQEVMARCLGVESGDLMVNAGSSHIYEDQMDKVPFKSSKTWKFQFEAPSDWFDFITWAREEITTLQTGGTPRFIEIVVE